MQKHGYKDLAKVYDLVNLKKDYVGEVDFLKSLFRKYSVKTILDVGCGTGTHMSLLEEMGFKCDGIDLNPEMLDIARTKVKGCLAQANMVDFSLGKKYDAIICMFAAFNHLLEPSYARKAITCFRNHLNRGGIILIDLHNPKSSGKKQDSIGNITRTMEWLYNPKTRLEKSSVVFNIDGKEVIDNHTMRIYSIDEMLKLLKDLGFSESAVYAGYGFNPAQSTSKNLEVFARWDCD
ncbi:MAG: class I SAM-dependent methyltransferase [DPANN group archaeon]|nr:class I SAM-dependent methyltransferase [DPANN group archaeon]